MAKKADLFRFKQFDVHHAKSTMKVGTDGVLLGAWADNGMVSTLLDIGTGCGLIALMAAQRFPKARVKAIDIDMPSVEEAAYNFQNSRWKEQLSAEHISLQEFSRTTEKFDLIVSNPPYFKNSTPSLHHWNIPN